MRAFISQGAAFGPSFSGFIRSAERGVSREKNCGPSNERMQQKKGGQQDQMCQKNEEELKANPWKFVIFESATTLMKDGRKEGQMERGRVRGRCVTE